MALIRLYNFLFGAVMIKITGDRPERFINALMNLRVKFWDIEKVSDGHGNAALIFRTSARFAREPMLEQIAKSTRTRYSIIKKTGLRYFLERHKNRLGLYAGIAAGLALIYASTFFIWEVKITKSDFPNDAEIIELLEKLGVRNGARINNIEPSEIQSRAILANPGIAWIAVNIKGTVANIEVKRREPAVEIVDTETPANIIAARSGKIIYIDVYDGVPVVLLDDSVQKGELMISGAIDSEVFGVRVTHAAGRVLAETSRVIEMRVPLRTMRKEHTGNTVRQSRLNIFGRNINLYLRGGTRMQKFDRTKSTENIALFGRIVLPMRILSTEYLEFEMRELIISEQEAEQIALAKLEQIIAERFDCENIAEITGKSFTGELRDGYYYLTGVVELIEDIAEEVPLAVAIIEPEIEAEP